MQGDCIHVLLRVATCVSGTRTFVHPFPPLLVQVRAKQQRREEGEVAPLVVLPRKWVAGSPRPSARKHRTAVSSPAFITSATPYLSSKETSADGALQTTSDLRCFAKKRVFMGAWRAFTP